jgi:hypothetical protein
MTKYWLIAVIPLSEVIRRHSEPSARTDISIGVSLHAPGNAFLGLALCCLKELRSQE